MFSFDQQFAQPLSFSSPFAQQQQQSSRYGGCFNGSGCSPLSAPYQDQTARGYPGLCSSNNNNPCSAQQNCGYPAPQNPLQQHQLPLGPSSSSPFFKDHRHILRDLFQDRQRDLALDQSIKKLVDSARFSRRSDHTVRHIMQGRNIEPQEIVRDILADRAKDQAISELVSLVLEERKYGRVLDNVLAHFEVGVSVPVGGAEELVKMQRQRYFDLQVAQAVQAVLMNDTASQFGGLGMGGQGAKPWGYPADPISAPKNTAPCFPGASCSPTAQFQSGCPGSAPQPACCPAVRNQSTCVHPGEFQAESAMMGPPQLYGGYRMDPDLAARSQLIAEIVGKKCM